MKRSETKVERGIRQRYWLSVAILLLSLPFIIHGATQAIETMRIAPERWVAASHPERQQFEQFRRQFEGNDIVLISWEGCTLDDHRLIQLEQAVAASSQDNGAPLYYDRIVTGITAVARLMESPVELSREEAIGRLQGTLIGHDRETSCALVVLTWEGNEYRAEAIDRLKQIAGDVTQLEDDAIFVAGPPHDGVAIDRASVIGVRVFSTLCTIVAATICAFSLRSWRLTGVIVGIACFGQGLSLSLIYFNGLTLDAILIVVPPLVFILTVSAGVHLVNYYAEAAQSPSEISPIARAFQTGWKPCLLASATTAVGLSSLAISHVTPVVHFGLIAAASLMGTTALLLMILPGELLIRPFDCRKRATTGLRHGLSLSPRLMKHSGWITAVGMMAMVISMFGLNRLATSVDTLALFSPDSQIVRDYHWFESNIGPVIPVEVVIEFPEEHSIGFRRRVELVDSVHRQLQQVEGLSGVVSALSFCPSLPQNNDGDSFWRAGFTFKKIAANREDLIAENYLFEDSTRQSWRITGHVSATAGADYEVITQRLKEAVGPLVASVPDAAGINVQYTGMMPLIQNVQATILNDLFSSFGTAFLLIAIAVAIVLRNIRLTMLAMLPNLFPVLMILGGMGWIGVAADIGTVMTASVALGIAVDDTIHFLTCYRRCVKQGEDNATAVREAFAGSAKAMLQTTMICSLGMLVFLLSDFMPTYRFGIVMVLSLVTALIGDLILLPALLVSRFGRWWAGERITGTRSIRLNQQSLRTATTGEPVE
jgi:predicted RND superfamily exporter protein